MAGVARSRIAFLDFAKGFTMLSIVLFHYLDASVVGSWSKYMVFGAAGVHLFMCSAGFGLSLSRFSASASAFYRRRFAKILVPYYLFVTIVMLVNQVHPYYRDATLYAYFGHIFWFKMFDSRIIYSLGGQLWFVSAIIPLYLAYPALARAMRVLGRWRFVLLASAISAAYWVAVASLRMSGNPVFDRFFLQYLWEFCLGMALADSYKETGRLLSEHSTARLLGAFVVGYAILALVTVQAGAASVTFDDAPSLVGFSAMAALAYRLVARFAPRLFGWFVAVGGVSFELFLVHMLVKAVLRPMLPAVAGGVAATAWVALTVAAAVGAAFAFQRLSRPVAEWVSGRILGASLPDDASAT